MKKIAIQGEAGSFSHDAARQMLPGCQIVPCSHSALVFNAVVKGKVDAAVIPIENTLAGSVSEHYDLLLSQPVYIQQEFYLRIVHNLIAKPGIRMKQLQRVISHPIALQQCRDFLQQHPQLKTTPFYDTAGSVKAIMHEQLTDTAAIASSLAADVYHAHILKKGIEDNKKNYTRFFLIHRKNKKIANANKTSLVFALKNTPGALFKALSVFALRDLDLSKIESRPVPGQPWEYVFYVDILRGNDAVLQNALRHLSEVTEFIKILGSYPAAKFKLTS